METHFYKGDIMLIFRLIIVLAVLFAALPAISYAVPVEWYEGNYELTSSNEWSWIPELHTYNDVTVTMNGGGVNQFYMYDNSELFMYGPDSSVDSLYLYENTTASFFGGGIMSELYIDPANTGWVKLYADFDRFEPLGPYGEGHIYGNWLSNGDPFNIHLVGNGAYSHIQFVPEPTTLVMLSLGGLTILKRRKR